MRVDYECNMKNYSKKSNNLINIVTVLNNKEGNIL
jgi:hypothetical protein